MTESYIVPFGEGEAEYVEKRSRFIGHVWPIDSEEEARRRIEETRKRHYDARHNCWCYILGDTVLRYSDDGEPQGTAGQPMLNVFQREGVGNVCCVVTRYFGGILLGAGGLTRAYGKAARDALSAPPSSSQRPSRAERNGPPVSGLRRKLGLRALPSCDTGRCSAQRP